MTPDHPSSLVRPKPSIEHHISYMISRFLAPRDAYGSQDDDSPGPSVVPHGIRRVEICARDVCSHAIPQEWGGLGLNLAQDVELAMELGYTSLALRSMFGTNNGIAGQVLVGFGTNEQKARWLEPMATGDVVASFALTEPGAGSNPSGLRTKAVRDGAQIGSSTARSASSPTPPLPICSSSSPAPGPPIRMARVSPSSWCPPTRQASRSA